MIDDMKNIQRRDDGTVATIRRSYSTTSAPPTMRTVGRSNTAPIHAVSRGLGREISPERASTSCRDKVPYLNYSTFSEPGDDHRDQPSSSMPHLDPFDEEEWDMSMTSSLPTEFDMRPDLTPTGDENHTLAFEIPVVRESPSHFAKTYRNSVTAENADDANARKHNSQGNIKSSIRFRKGHTFARKLFAIVRTSIISTLLLTVLFSCLIILVIETESDMFAHLRKLPEVVMLRRDYYEPTKKFLIRSISR